MVVRVVRPEVVVKLSKLRILRFRVIELIKASSPSDVMYLFDFAFLTSSGRHCAHNPNLDLPRFVNHEGLQSRLTA
jgi:hypothetical protein